MDFETRLAMEWEGEIQKYRLACQHLLKEFTFALNAWVKTALEQMPANWRASWDAFVQAWSAEGVELKDHWKRDFAAWLEFYEREAQKTQARKAVVKSPVAKGERDSHGPIPGPFDYGNSRQLSQEELLAETAWIRRVGPFAGLLRHLRSSRERKYVTIEERHRLHSSGVKIIEREQARLVLTTGETKELDQYLTDLMFTLDNPNWPPTVPESWSKKDRLAWRESEDSKTRPSISAIAPGWDAKVADRQNKLRHPESTPYFEYERLLEEERLDEQARYYRGWGFFAMTFDRFMNPAWAGLGNMDDMAMALAGVGPAYIPPGPRGPIFFGDNRPANVEYFWREAASQYTLQPSEVTQRDFVTTNRGLKTEPNWVTDDSQRPSTSKQYTNWFDAKLTRGTHYPNRPDTVHFKEANRQLWERLQADALFAEALEAAYPGITEFLRPGPRGGIPDTTPAPFGLTWNHSTTREGILELVPLVHHRASGAVQTTLHPNQQGGMKTWGGGRRKRKKGGS